MSIFIKISLFHASKSVWIFQNFEIVKMEGRTGIQFENIWFLKFRKKNLKTVEIQGKTGFFFIENFSQLPAFYHFEP